MVRENIDTLDSLMARYVAGSLPEPVSVMVQSLIDIRPSSRTYVHRLEELAGDALTGIDAAELAPERRKAMLETIFHAPDAPDRKSPVEHIGKTGIFPKPLIDFFGFDAEHVPWKAKLPGFREYKLGPIDGCDSSLYWIRPGRRIHQHTHDGMELTLVLDGAFSDETGHYGRGDLSIADETVEHHPVAEKHRPCICLTVTDAPLKFTGSLRQNLSDLLG